MLTAEGCAARRERLWEALPSACDLLIVGDPSHLIYFAGLRRRRRSCSGRSSPAPLLAPASRDGRRWSPTTCSGRSSTGRSSTRSSPRPGTTAKHSAPYRRGKLVAIGARPPGDDAGPTRSASSWRASRRAWSRDSARHGPDLEIVDLGPIIRPLRRSKDPDEIAVLRRSMRAGEAAHAAALAEVEPGDDRAGRLSGRPGCRDRGGWASR